MTERKIEKEWRGGRERKRDGRQRERERERAKHYMCLIDFCPFESKYTQVIYDLYESKLFLHTYIQNFVTLTLLPSSSAL